MQSERSGESFFDTLYVAVFLLMAANIAVYLLCFKESGSQAISNDVLLRNGAMYSFAIKRHEYWRLIAYGFLHANLLHIATNMFCLMYWGSFLERRIGLVYFVLIYTAALVAGALASDYQHTGQFVAVGASGATSGLLGALFALWILGKLDVRANFFVLNIGLNIVISATVPNIDWASHIGGFAAGLIGCGILDLVEKANSVALRCKFPEFVKVNLVLALGVGGWLLWDNHTLWNSQAMSAAMALGPHGPVAAMAVAALLIIKLVDLVLSLKKGLAIIVMALCAVNAGLVILAGTAFASRWPSTCTTLGTGWMSAIKPWLNTACSNTTLAIYVAAACVGVLTIFLYSPALYRGMRDVGFIGSSLRDERSRRFGI
jgi:membrane associated rhomboid family serine protease